MLGKDIDTSPEWAPCARILSKSSARKTALGNPALHSTYPIFHRRMFRAIGGNIMFILAQLCSNWDYCAIATRAV